MYRMAIVDDEPLMLEGFSKALDWQAYGYELVGAFGNPFDLIEFCKKEKPDIILLDISMPELDGIMLLKHIKEMYPNIYVIMLTAHNDFSYVRESLRYHADEYIWKPEVGFEDILECMDKLLKDRDKNTQENIGKKLYEFTDYEENRCRFSQDAFRKVMVDAEYALKMEDVQKFCQIKEQISQMIIRDRPSKESLLGGMFYLFSVYQDCLGGGKEVGQEDIRENDILDVFCDQNSYEEFAGQMELLYDRMCKNLEWKEAIEKVDLQKKIEFYMEEHLAETDLNLMKVSNAVGLSYSYCSRIFPEITGKNFSKYLIDLRMEKTCEYLKFSDYRIEKIVELVGYLDKSYFIKSFRQHTTMTPSQYRKKYR